MIYYWYRCSSAQVEINLRFCLYGYCLSQMVDASVAKAQNVQLSTKSTFIFVGCSLQRCATALHHIENSSKGWKQFLFFGGYFIYKWNIRRSSPTALVMQYSDDFLSFKPKTFNQSCCSGDTERHVCLFYPATQSQALNRRKNIWLSPNYSNQDKLNLWNIQYCICLAEINYT